MRATRNALELVLVLAAAMAACESATDSDPDATTDTEPGETGVDDPSSDEAGTSAESSTGVSEESGGETQPGACDDGVENGDEEGVDCGGSCMPCAPPAWSCESRFYGDGVCQCGCGVVDIDCESTDVSACAYALCPDGQALEPGQTIVCTDVPEVPADWVCSEMDFGDSVCDCGCGVLDFDCESLLPASCADTNCPEFFEVDAENNAHCLAPPADAVLNPSFEEIPVGFGDVPGWTVLDDVGGVASAQVVGAGQTDAPDGTRALRLESTNADLVGARTVRSSPFLPPAGTCTVAVAIGDSNEDGEYTDFGQIRVRSDLPPPLDLVAEVEIDNRGQGGISPPIDGYTEATLVFDADGSTIHYVEIRVRGSLGTLSYHADDVRIECAGG